MVNRRSVLVAGTLLAASARFPALAAAPSHQLTAAQESRIAALVAAMTLDEKLGQMTQIAGGRQIALNSRLDAAALDRVRAGRVGSFLHVAGAEPLLALQRVAVEESRLGIPLLFAMDVVHGYRTIFPVPLAMAASFDPDVARQASRVAAVESSVSGLHWTFAPMIDIARDARWGRVVEGAGEDPYLGARIAVAQIEGFQTADLDNPDAMLACAKHIGAYGAAIGGRDYDSAELSERTLRETYLAPFHAASNAGVGTMMTAFNDLAGVPTTGNADLVRGILRQEWGYQGLVVSDWNAIKELMAHGAAATPAEAAALALRASVDMDMTSDTYADHLGTAVAADPTLLPLVDEAVGRILAAKARLGLFDDPFRFGDAARQRVVLGSAEHRAAARRAAQRSIVLLRNEGEVLPIAAGRRIALIGALADDASSTLGSWRARGRAEESVTLRQALGEAGNVDYVPGAEPRSDDTSGIADAVAAANRADVVVVALGEDYDYSGEARSRSDITLPGAQTALIEALRATGKPVVAVLMNGRPLALEDALADIPAVVETWFLGNESGHAIADVLLGRISPAGRLPMGIPRRSGQMPMFYAHPPTGRPADPDLAVDSARYRDVDIGPLFPFGHGLSYGRFAYSGLQVAAQDAGEAARYTVALNVRNTGTVAADEVVQLYVRAPVAGLARPVKELRGFARVPLAPGQSRRVTFMLGSDQFAHWDDGWKVAAGDVDIMVGSSSEDIRQTAVLTVPRSYPLADGAMAGAALPTDVTIG
ncbi:glycoside hydrolase family 3 N-terminal domain-containing protein [Croceicoccus marinus]|uniref:Beta-D-glucoside glucohydrolase n=1 Tax=Croceicoccus marinus TaxID=450378 RepID=A0A1Z1FBE0_9SPHN|nr:glycoside hydrolase family 3 N-terminal domain-containing protein [Croceicoccus marinus]ARU16138.1 beta-glucosidase [Croceicoccus marinus]